jgi:four helix bundle protein
MRAIARRPRGVKRKRARPRPLRAPRVGRRSRSEAGVPASCRTVLAEASSLDDPDVRRQADELLPFKCRNRNGEWGMSQIGGEDGEDGEERIHIAWLAMCVLLDAMVACHMLAHQELRAWELCHELTLAIYRSTESRPRQELYGLISQLRRAAVSAAANIAEGAAKRGPSEFARFVDMSVGSLAEIAYLLMLAKELDLLPTKDYERLEDLRRRAGGLTWRLVRGLRRQQE